ncbi:maternal embryonic leucine zipper kinase-like protein 1, partial [Leptotrombidium deliense]
MDKNKLGEDLFRVKTEIQALRTLQHKNIAKLLQVIENDTKIYLILEYCSGGELFDYIVAKSRLSEKESRQIMHSLLECLAYLHSHGFAHRDLKPENVLFDRNHNIKLIDFGLAAQSKESTKSLFHLKTCCGSPAYAAPELIAGEEYSGPAVDVWSAGVMLYALLVGQLPFDDENLTVLYKKIQSGQYKTPFWLSEQSKSVIASMLTTNPRKRITVKELLQHPWITGSSGEKQLVAVQKMLIDESLLWEVHKYFPLVALPELRKNIATKFGYQTATFWLLKDQYERNPNMFVTRKQSASAESVLDKISEESDDKLKKNKSDDLLSPKLVAVHPKAVESRKHKLHAPPVSHVTPAKRAAIYSTPTSSPVSKIPIKSPLRDSNATPVAPLNLQKPSQNGETPMKTPMKQFLVQTPKRSLLKRFLATATPSVATQPRNITTSIHTTSKNVTMTTFTDADECTKIFIESLTAKGIICKQKGYLIRCQMNNKYQKVLNFTLEVCKYGDCCAIQRNRLHGDAWHYKKICEEILRISNQNNQ